MSKVAIALDAVPATTKRGTALALQASTEISVSIKA